MEVDDIISYHDLVTEERAALQKGMNYGVGKNYSVFLMWLRRCNARESARSSSDNSAVASLHGHAH